jgi:hypothetical protein
MTTLPQLVYLRALCVAEGAASAFVCNAVYCCMALSAAVASTVASMAVHAQLESDAQVVRGELTQTITRTALTCWCAWCGVCHMRDVCVVVKKHV